MNTTLAKGQVFTWRDIPVRDLRSVRARLIKKYDTLTKAAAVLGIRYNRISDAINGRDYLIAVIEKIQEAIELSNHEVLMLWPLLREWPKTDRRAA